MRVLIDINHPAHIHFFKNLYVELKERGHFVAITATEKDIATLLLKKYNIPFINIGRYRSPLFLKFIDFIIIAIKFIFIVNKLKPDYIFSISSARPFGKVGYRKVKTYIFTDTEHATEQIRLFKPFATKIFTPLCFEVDLGKKHIKYNGYHELAYLHPDKFKPNIKTLNKINLKETDVFFVLRFVSWEASHDLGQSGISLHTKQQLVKLLEKKGKVVISSEGNLSPEFEKYRMSICPSKMHDLLYYSSLFIGEGATMASECAVLGTPCIYVNSLDAGTLKDQVKNGLLISLRSEKKLINIAQKKIDNLNNEKIKIKANSRKILKEKINVAEFILNLIPLKSKTF